MSSPTTTRELSYTRLSTYKECPERYRLKYVERIPEVPAVWSVGGTAFHSVAEWYLRGDLGANPEPHRVRDAWDAAWQIAFDDQLRKYPDVAPRDWRAASRGAEDQAWWVRAGLTMVRDFIEWKQGPGASLQVLTEGERALLEADLHVVLGGVPVVAIPDWLAVDEHGQVCIVDYKTGKPPRESLQLGVYKAAVEAGLGYEPAWGLYYMARDVRLLPIDLRRYDPAAIGNQFAWLQEQLEAQEFPPQPSKLCDFCPYRAKHCRYYNPETV